VLPPTPRLVAGVSLRQPWTRESGDMLDIVEAHQSIYNHPPQVVATAYKPYLDRTRALTQPG
jgi:hypothetical protein